MVVNALVHAILQESPRKRAARTRADPEKKAKEVSVKLTGRLRKHAGNPKYKALAERLEDLKNRYQQGLLLSIDFLKELLELAKDVVKMERETPVEEDIDSGKAALTELFQEAQNGDGSIDADASDARRAEATDPSKTRKPSQLSRKPVPEAAVSPPPRRAPWRGRIVSRLPTVPDTDIRPAPPPLHAGHPERRA